MKIAIIGRTQLLYETARLFAQSGHAIVLVATCKEAPEYTVMAQDFEQLATQHGAAFLAGPHLGEHTDTIKAAGADIAISMNWPYILGGDIISLFSHGILNAHPGDLPRYRGNACPNWAIINGEDRVTLTIHQMAPGELDSGDILLKGNIPLVADTTIGQVYQKLEEMMPSLYLQAAEGLVGGSITPQKQSTDPGDILRVYPRLPQDSLLDWRQPADALDRLVRASSQPFSGAYTHHQGKKLVVWRAAPGAFAVPSCASPGQVTAIDRATGAVSVAAGEGFLTLYCVSYDGAVYEKPAELIRSMRARLGPVPEDDIAALRAEVDALKQRLAALEGRP